MSDKKEVKVKVKEKEIIEYFTDEMHENIYLFQPAMSTKNGGGKPVLKVHTLGSFRGRK
mgnify:CR=1 FL=1